LEGEERAQEPLDSVTDLGAGAGGKGLSQEPLDIAAEVGAGAAAGVGAGGKDSSQEPLGLAAAVHEVSGEDGTVEGVGSEKVAIGEVIVAAMALWREVREHREDVGLAVEGALVDRVTARSEDVVTDVTIGEVGGRGVEGLEGEEKGMGEGEVERGLERRGVDAGVGADVDADVVADVGVLSWQEVCKQGRVIVTGAKALMALLERLEWEAVGCDVMRRPAPDVTLPGTDVTLPKVDVTLAGEDLVALAEQHLLLLSQQPRGGRIGEEGVLMRDVTVAGMTAEGPVESVGRLVDLLFFMVGVLRVMEKGRGMEREGIAGKEENWEEEGGGSGEGEIVGNEVEEDEEEEEEGEWEEEWEEEEGWGEDEVEMDAEDGDEGEEEERRRQVELWQRSGKLLEAATEHAAVLAGRVRGVDRCSLAGQQAEDGREERLVSSGRQMGAVGTSECKGQQRAQRGQQQQGMTSLFALIESAELLWGCVVSSAASGGDDLEPGAGNLSGKAAGAAAAAAAFRDRAAAHGVQVCAAVAKNPPPSGATTEGATDLGVAQEGIALVAAAAETVRGILISRRTSLGLEQQQEQKEQERLAEEQERGVEQEQVQEQQQQLLPPPKHWLSHLLFSGWLLLQRHAAAAAEAAAIVEGLGAGGTLETVSAPSVTSTLQHRLSFLRTLVEAYRKLLQAAAGFCESHGEKGGGGREVMQGESGLGGSDWLGWNVGVRECEKVCEGILQEVSRMQGWFEPAERTDDLGQGELSVQQVRGQMLVSLGFSGLAAVAGVVREVETNAAHDPTQRKTNAGNREGCVKGGGCGAERRRQQRKLGASRRSKREGRLRGSVIGGERAGDGGGSGEAPGPGENGTAELAAADERITETSVHVREAGRLLDRVRDVVSGLVVAQQWLEKGGSDEGGSERGGSEKGGSDRAVLVSLQPHATAPEKASSDDSQASSHGENAEAENEICEDSCYSQQAAAQMVLGVLADSVRQFCLVAGKGGFRDGGSLAGSEMGAERWGGKLLRRAGRSCAVVIGAAAALAGRVIAEDMGGGRGRRGGGAERRGGGEEGRDGGREEDLGDGVRAAAHALVHAAERHLRLMKALERETKQQHQQHQQHQQQQPCVVVVEEADTCSRAAGGTAGELQGHRALEAAVEESGVGEDSRHERQRPSAWAQGVSALGLPPCVVAPETTLLGTVKHVWQQQQQHQCSKSTLPAFLPPGSNAVLMSHGQEHARLELSLSRVLFRAARLGQALLPHVPLVLPAKLAPSVQRLLDCETDSTAASSAGGFAWLVGWTEVVGGLSAQLVRQQKQAGGGLTGGSEEGGGGDAVRRELFAQAVAARELARDLLMRDEPGAVGVEGSGARSDHGAACSEYRPNGEGGSPLLVGWQSTTGVLSQAAALADLAAVHAESCVEFAESAAAGSGDDTWQDLLTQAEGLVLETSRQLEMLWQAKKQRSSSSRSSGSGSSSRHEKGWQEECPAEISRHYGRTGRDGEEGDVFTFTLLVRMVEQAQSHHSLLLHAMQRRVPGAARETETSAPSVEAACGGGACGAGELACRVQRSAVRRSALLLRHGASSLLHHLSITHAAMPGHVTGADLAVSSSHGPSPNAPPLPSTINQLALSAAATAADLVASSSLLAALLHALLAATLDGAARTYLDAPSCSETSAPSAPSAPSQTPAPLDSITGAAASAALLTQHRATVESLTLSLADVAADLDTQLARLADACLLRSACADVALAYWLLSAGHELVLCSHSHIHESRRGQAVTTSVTVSSTTAQAEQQIGGVTVTDSLAVSGATDLATAAAAAASNTRRAAAVALRALRLLLSGVTGGCLPAPDRPAPVAPAPVAPDPLMPPTLSSSLQQLQTAADSLLGTHSRERSKTSTGSLAAPTTIPCVSWLRLCSQALPLMSELHTRLHGGRAAAAAFALSNRLRSRPPIAAAVPVVSALLLRCLLRLGDAVALVWGETDGERAGRRRKRRGGRDREKEGSNKDGNSREGSISRGLEHQGELHCGWMYSSDAAAAAVAAAGNADSAAAALLVRVAPPPPLASAAASAAAEVALIAVLHHTPLPQPAYGSEQIGQREEGAGGVGNGGGEQRERGEEGDGVKGPLLDGAPLPLLLGDFCASVCANAAADLAAASVANTNGTDTTITSTAVAATPAAAGATALATACRLAAEASALLSMLQSLVSDATAAAATAAADATDATDAPDSLPAVSGATAADADTACSAGTSAQLGVSENSQKHSPQLLLPAVAMAGAAAVVAHTVVHALSLELALSIGLQSAETAERFSALVQGAAHLSHLLKNHLAVLQQAANQGCGAPRFFLAMTDGAALFARKLQGHIAELQLRQRRISPGQLEEHSDWSQKLPGTPGG
ncbi:hypothetical protein CLOM_g4933, partial [Closterium sp. NIES-68]